MSNNEYQKATFAAGCFWGVEEKFSNTRGVVSTRVGYTGGRTENPTYEDVCAKNTGHAEAIEITFNPDNISYKELLPIFFSLHSPGSVIGQGENSKSQYRGAAFYHNHEQKGIIEQEIERLEKEKKYGPKIYTQIAPIETFWAAEDYHQQYYKKSG